MNRQYFIIMFPFSVIVANVLTAPTYSSLTFTFLCCCSYIARFYGEVFFPFCNKTASLSLLFTQHYLWVGILIMLFA